MKAGPGALLRERIQSVRGVCDVVLEQMDVRVERERRGVMSEPRLPDFTSSEPGWAPGDVLMYNPAMEFRVTAVITPDS